ncbi:MATE family efflux transporter [Streptomyces thermolineatus]|uniref:Probable multidrug resistance protein NorM n=1 Tax=Streptomyces thermolineatus TaxID=44033 RepID=A0ABP5ZSF2_9ACTN
MVTGIVDMLWVARLGGAAVAAVTVATNVENVLLGVVLMSSSGTTVLVARAAGAGSPGGVRAAVRGGWALFALVTPVVAVGGWCVREPLARLLLGGADGGAAVESTAGFLAVSLPGITFLYAQTVLNGTLKGTGDTRTPMRLALLANGLNLALDPLLIHGLLGMPELGVQGAALATVAGRSAALAAGFAVLRRNGPVREAARAPGTESVTAALRRTAAVGLPLSGDFLVRMAGSLALVAVVARLGVTPVAAYGIATKAMYVVTMAFYAVRQATAIHTSHLLGAGHDERPAIGRQAVLTGGAVAVLASVLLLPTAPWAMRLFGAEPDAAAAGALFLQCIGPYLVLLGCFIPLGGVFEGSGEGSLLLRVTVLGTVAQLALAHGLSGLGLPGVCLAMALSAALQWAAVAALFRRLGADAAR